MWQMRQMWKKKFKLCTQILTHSLFLSVLISVFWIKKNHPISDRIGHKELHQKKTFDSNYKWQCQAEKREKPTLVPLLFCFNSVNRPKVKISCSCQFNSASNDVATRSLLLFFISYSFFLLFPFLPPPPSLHPTLHSPPFLFLGEQDWVVM